MHRSVRCEEQLTIYSTTIPIVIISLITHLLLLSILALTRHWIFNLIRIGVKIYINCCLSGFNVSSLHIIVILGQIKKCVVLVTLVRII
jgi:hypothetical protein